MEEFKYQRFRVDKIPKENILNELEKAAKHYDYKVFSWRKFDQIASISHNLVKREYGSWKNGLDALRKHLQQKGLELSARSFVHYSDNQLFNEMERIWKIVGQRPSRIQWEMFKPTISYNTYVRRFGKWSNACLKFIEYKMGGSIVLENESATINEKQVSDSIKNQNRSIKRDAELGRNISLRMRLMVLEKYNFKCFYCGRSPVTDVGVKLHIDHILAFSKGGKSTLDNLQTLCQDCNLGKGNKDQTVPE